MDTPKTNNNRRKFIKTSGAAVGATAIAPRLAGAFAGGSEEVKVGLVGCGGKGTSDIRQVLSVGGSVKLWAMGDAFEGNAQNRHKAMLADRNKAKVECEGRVFSGLDAYRKVIDSGVDIVFLVTSPGFRPVHFDYAVNQGKHVFM